MSKSAQAFRTIREVADWLGVAAHVLRFWESKFTQIKPVKRAGGRRYYRPADMALVGGIKVLLHDRGLTIRGVQKMISEQGIEAVTALSPPVDDPVGDSSVIDMEPAQQWEADADTELQTPSGAPDPAPEVVPDPQPEPEAAPDTPTDEAPDPEPTPAPAPTEATSPTEAAPTAPEPTPEAPTPELEAEPEPEPSIQPAAAHAPSSEIAPPDPDTEPSPPAPEPEADQIAAISIDDQNLTPAEPAEAYTHAPRFTAQALPEMPPWPPHDAAEGPLGQLAALGQWPPEARGRLAAPRAELAALAARMASA